MERTAFGSRGHPRADLHCAVGREYLAIGSSRRTRLPLTPFANPPLSPLNPAHRRRRRIDLPTAGSASLPSSKPLPSPPRAPPPLPPCTHRSRTAGYLVCGSHRCRPQIQRPPATSSAGVKVRAHRLPPPWLPSSLFASSPPYTSFFFLVWIVL